MPAPGAPETARDEPVVLVHGLGSSAAHGWGANGWLDLLADAKRNAVALDLLGHGEAPAPHDPEAYRDLDRWLEERLPNGSVDAIGFSLGAQLLLRIAARDPQRFRRLVVIGVGENLFRADQGDALATAFEGGHDPDDLTARLFVQLAATAGNDARAIAACVRRPHDPFTHDELARVTCPTLVVIGDRDFAGPADRLVDALPDVRLVVLRGIDHFRAPADFGCIDAALQFVDAAL